MLSLSEEGINPSSLYKVLFNEEVYLVKEKGEPYVAPVVPKEPVTPPPEGKVVAEEKILVAEQEAIIIEELSWVPEGNSQSEVLVLFHYPEANIPDDEKELLSKILIAARLDYEKIAKSNLADYPALEWADIAHLSTASIIFAFGVPDSFLPEELEEGKMFTNSNKTVVRSASLATMATDNTLKKTLWQFLKDIYQL